MSLIRMNDPADLEDVNPIESRQYPGYYHYPEEPKLLVSRRSRVINSDKGEFINGSVERHNRRMIVVSFSSDGKTVTQSLHRIVARTFCGRPTRHVAKSFSELEVNHIDGQRSNNIPENLEWVTPAENVLHGHLSGFHPRDKPVIAKSLLTGKETRFSSAKNCADYFEVNRATFFKHLKRGHDGKRKAKNHVYKYDDGKDWPTYDVDEITELGYMRKSLGAVVSRKGVMEFIHENSKEAACFHNIPNVAVWRNLKRYGVFERDGIVFRFLID